MRLKKLIQIFLSITVFVCEVGNSLTEFLRNEHLVVVGKDLNGTSKVWIVPKLSAPSVTVTTVPIGPDHVVSSAYTEQSSRSRELTVESTHISNETSLHHVFVPLENGILNVTFMYNRSAAQDIGNETQITVVKPHTLYRFGAPCPRMCASLGANKIRDSLYTLCASSSGICRCKLSQTNQQHSTILLSTRECRLLSYPNADHDIIVEQVSDIVTYLPNRIELHLLFTLNNYIYQDDLIHGAHGDERPIYFSNSANCQIVLRLRKINESKLLIYCANHTMVEHNFITDDSFQFSNHLYFPCSDAANFTVNLTNSEHADIHYYRMDNSHRQFSRLQAGREFKFGECIEYENHHLFLYTDWSNTLRLINSSIHALPVYNVSTNDQYARPLIVGERYIVTHSLDHQTTSVFDLQDTRSPIITHQDIMLLQLATMVSNLSIAIEIEPTSTTSSAAMTLSPTPSYSTMFSISAPATSTAVAVTTSVTYDMTTSSPINLTEPEVVIGPPIAIAVVLIILCSSVGGIIGAICCYRRSKEKSKPPPPVISTSPPGSYEHDVLPTGAGIAIRNLRRETDSASCASISQLQSSRNRSGSEILAPATPLSGSLLGGSSRCSSASPLYYSQGHESNSNYQHEIESSDTEVVPIAETNVDESRSNATQTVV